VSAIPYSETGAKSSPLSLSSMNEYKKKTEYNQTKRRIFMKWKIYISPENVVATTYKSFFSDFEIANDKIR
jgi:hypothetical protein